MDTSKIVAGFAFSFLIALFTLIFFIENSEKKHFENLVELIMTNEGVFSSEEVLNTFPELMEIKLKMNRISSLQKRIHSITAGPAPNVTIEEEFLLNECNSEISRLKRSVKEQLVQLIASPAIVKSH